MNKKELLEICYQEVKAWHSKSSIEELLQESFLNNKEDDDYFDEKRRKLSFGGKKTRLREVKFKMKTNYSMPKLDQNCSTKLNMIIDNLCPYPKMMSKSDNVCSKTVSET